MSNNNLFVGNLSYQLTEEELREAFEQFGTVTEARIIMDRETGRSRGFGFVKMSTGDEAQAAMEGLHEQPVGGRNLSVREAMEKARG